MNNWNSITIQIIREAEEAVSHIFIEAGADGVEINDSADYLQYECRFGEVLPQIKQSKFVEVTAYYPEKFPIVELKTDIEYQISTLSDFFDVSDVKISIRSLAEEDWEEAWKKYFKPVRVTHDLTIVPNWIENYQVQWNEKLLKLDPGMAFGTGTHPTTKLSLFALEQIMRGGETVLDVGTGSGVLSIASVLLGARNVCAYDIDDVAVRVAKENIALNPNTERIHVSANNLLAGIEQEADVIVANILADILLLMIDDAYRLVKINGYFVMSGIITDKVDMIIKKTKKVGFFLETQMTQGEWNCLIFKKVEESKGVISG